MLNALMLDWFLSNSFWLHKMLSGVDYCDVLPDVWTLILTAPIHCRASIDEQVMEVLDDLWQYGTFKFLHIAPLAHLTPFVSASGMFRHRVNHVYWKSASVLSSQTL